MGMVGPANLARAVASRAHAATLDMREDSGKHAQVFLMKMR